MTSARFEVKRNWPRAIACARGLVNPVRYHEDFLEFTMALAGPGFRNAYDRFRADPNGRRLLEEKPVIQDKLLDDTYLAGLPKGSLGHAYHDFMNQNRLDAALYDEAHDLPAIADRLGWDDDFYYVIHRGIILHDMLHVLGGYGPDVGGEIGVIAFTHGQAPSPATGVALVFALVLPGSMPVAGRRRFWAQGVARGRKAAMLMAQPYEDLLDKPLDEVRADLDVDPIEIGHPSGVLYSRFQFGGRGTRMTEKAFEPYRYDPDRDHAAI